MKPFGHSDFVRAFRPGEIFVHPLQGPLEVLVERAADIAIPSGRLIACDPVSIEREEWSIPYSRTVTPGTYPVALSILKAPDEKERRGTVACARIEFTDRNVASWEQALLPEQDPNAVPLGRFHGYGVDTGLGCFVDAAAARRLSATEVENLTCDPQMLDETYRRGWSSLVLPQGDSNLVVFSAGYGDGSYPSFWGLDRLGQAACLVTDFGVLVEGLCGQATFPIQAWLDRDIVHPDLQRIGITVRLVSPGRWPLTSLRVEMRGGNIHRAVIASGDKEYSSESLGFSMTNWVGSYDFKFHEPLAADAAITLDYSMGSYGL